MSTTESSTFDWQSLQQEFLAAYRQGLVTGALLSGLVAGGIPLIIGAARRRLGLGLGGFITCIIGGFIGGLLVALPVAALFTWGICAPQDQNQIQSIDWRTIDKPLQAPTLFSRFYSIVEFLFIFLFCAVLGLVAGLYILGKTGDDTRLFDEPKKYAASNNADTYIPLNEGRTWKYLWTISSQSQGVELATVIVRTLAPQNLKGKNVYPMEVYMDPPKKTLLAFAARDSEGISQVAIQQEELVSPKHYSPPSYYLKYPLQTGTSWSDQGQFLVFERWAYKQLTSTIESVDETVIVPAGRFTGCLKVRTVRADMDNQHWFAPNVGIVKAVCSISSNGMTLTNTLELESFTETSPVDDLSEIHYKNGQTYEQLSDYANAISSYKKAIRTRPDYHQAYARLGAAYTKLELWSQALTAFKEAVSLKPDFAEAQVGLGYIYGRLKRYQEAIESYNRAIQINPNDGSVRYQLCLLYIMTGNRESAIAEYKALTSIDPELAKKIYDRTQGEEKDILGLPDPDKPNIASQSILNETPSQESQKSPHPPTQTPPQQNGRGIYNLDPNRPTTIVDTRPILLNRPRPDYTEKARKNKVEGVVRVKILVGPDGGVRQVQLEGEGLPDGLNEEAVRAAYQMRFKAAMKDGQAVAFWQAVDIEFSLR